MNLGMKSADRMAVYSWHGTQSEKDNLQLHATSGKEELDYYKCFWSLNNEN
jgi:hypothetical protein